MRYGEYFAVDGLNIYDHMQESDEMVHRAVVSLGDEAKRWRISLGIGVSAIALDKYRPERL